MGVAWGLLSTARINLRVLAAARESDRADVVAVASRDAARAAAYAEEHGLARAHGSYEALLEDPGVEAVYISLPNALHVPWTLRALEAGKHVLCEKPLSRRAADADAAFDAAERAGKLLAEGFMYRHHPQTRRLEALVRDGAIGRLQLIRGSFSFAIGDQPGNVRLSPELEGGALMDVGCYPVSAARALGGEPERVLAEQVVGTEGVDLRFAGTLRLPDGVLAQVDCGLTGPARGELEAIGTEGSLWTGDPWHVHGPGLELRRDGEVETIAVEAADSYQLELDDASAAIRGEAAPLLGRADAVGQARALEALYRSAEEGRAIDVHIN